MGDRSDHENSDPVNSDAVISDHAENSDLPVNSDPENSDHVKLLNRSVSDYYPCVFKIGCRAVAPRMVVFPEMAYHVVVNSADTGIRHTC